MADPQRISPRDCTTPGLGRAIVTCRVNVWEADQNAFSGFDVYRNLPFEMDQMEMFIRRFFAHSD